MEEYKILPIMVLIFLVATTIVNLIFGFIYNSGLNFFVAGYEIGILFLYIDKNWS